MLCFIIVILSVHYGSCILFICFIIVILSVHYGSCILFIYIFHIRFTDTEANVCLPPWKWNNALGYGWIWPPPNKNKTCQNANNVQNSLDSLNNALSLLQQMTAYYAARYLSNTFLHCKWTVGILFVYDIRFRNIFRNVYCYDLYMDTR